MYKPIRPIASNRKIDIQTLYQGTYYLFYKESQNPKKCKIGIRYPGIDSTPFVVLGGKRAKDIYNFINQLLENSGIKHLTQKIGKMTLTELPLATGLATTIFLLTAYSSLNPLRHATTLEKMILGKMPFTKYFVTLTELSTDLSNYLGEKEPTNQTIDRQAAKTVSKMLLELMDGIEKKNSS
jgi:hypothetical protein